VIIRVSKSSVDFYFPVFVTFFDPVIRLLSTVLTMFSPLPSSPSFWTQLLANATPCTVFLISRYKSWRGQSVAYRGEGSGGLGGSNPPSKFRRPSKIVPNSTRLWKLLKIA